MKPAPKRLIIYCDGAADPNPGPASIGAVLLDEEGTGVAQIHDYIGHSTNNQAEYRALIAALEMALKLGATEVEVRSDSELMVRQICGQYKVRNPAIRPLYQKVVSLLDQLHSYTIQHIPGWQNAAHSVAQMGFKLKPKAPGRPKTSA